MEVAGGRSLGSEGAGAGRGLREGGAWAASLARPLQLRGPTAEASLPGRRRRLSSVARRGPRTARRPGAALPGRCLPLQAAAAPGVGGERGPRGPAWGGCSHAGLAHPEPRVRSGEQGIADAGSRAGKCVGASAASGMPGPQPPPDPPGSAQPEPRSLPLGRLTRATAGSPAEPPQLACGPLRGDGGVDLLDGAGTGETCCPPPVANPRRSPAPPRRRSARNKESLWLP